MGWIWNRGDKQPLVDQSVEEILANGTGSADIAKSVTEVVGNIERQRRSYGRRATWHRRHFRSSGIVIIIVSASLPLLAGLDFGAKDMTIAILGVVVAVLTALRSFYQWDHLWSVLRQSDFELGFLIDKWELAVAEVQPDREFAAEEILDLTSELRKAAEEVRRAESTRYFGSLRPPLSEKPA